MSISLSRALLSIACHQYSVAAIFYLAFLVRQAKGLPLAGRVLVGTGLILHAASFWGLGQAAGGMPLGMAPGFSLLSFLLLAIFFFIDLRYDKPVLGAFLTPAAVAVLLPAFLLPSDALPPAVRQPLLPVHIGIAILGLAAFAVAAGVAVIYLLMDRQMKVKRFGMLFSRLPPLQFLDELNRRLVTFGFIALSITLLTGAFFSSEGRGFPWVWSAKEIATVVAWLLFAVLQNARFFAGWQGKRVAFLTMAGFGLLLVSFFSSYHPTFRSTGLVH